ncbi:hypothetical protein F0562_001961 [Nyssa sinensis]|uniref:Lysosomal Pro-X carboxypeptidase n=1 Tax=Nyssa sinensis TaxID=561372 RepID=A0A5J5C8I1_9ASTE|nr:hypothetical protein F0562_001961 [Nyssa sinensis]
MNYYSIATMRDSMPFGSEYEAFQNASTLGFFSSTQALADYAQLITDLKRNLSAENCPTIAVGGSYGGMLASWFRLKYPHISCGALASSAPILYFDDITPQNGYPVVVTKDFRDTSESCYNTIRQSWSEIDRVAAEPNGLSKLSQIFATCLPLNSSEELKSTLEVLFWVSAQYDNPPDNPVENLCNAIDRAAEGTDILGKIAAGLNASIGPPCHDMFDLKPSNKDGWTWQTCTEMVIPIGNGDNDTMFQPSPFDLNNFTRTCEGLFGVTPRPHWITTEFGGHDIKSVLGNFASNIIFSNGLRDPYSAGGVLQNISDTVLAVYTEKGAHCLDLLTPMASDPDWLVSQRDTEIKIIQGWIAEYRATRAS